MTTWGIVSTILAPAPEILRFVAYHIELGAHRVYIYLDDDNPAAFKALKSHAKVRVQTRDPEWYASRDKRRPLKHQVRQTMNATHAYRRKVEVDWLAHIDVDEFIVPARPIAEGLDGVAAPIARIRPMEQLADGDGRAYKAFIPPGPDRTTLVNALYPNFGPYLRGGFLSHASGKLFLRTGLEGVSLRIHKAFQQDAEIVEHGELAPTMLAHRHAQSWEDWRARYRYRLEHGAYRAELDPARAEALGEMSLHELLRYVEATDGEAGLRRFHDEVAADTPDLRARLDARGLLRLVDLDLDGPAARQFPSEFDA